MRNIRFVILAAFVAFISLHGQANAVTYDAQLSFLDTNEPSSISFLFAFPIAPLTGTFQSTLDVSGMLTDGGVDGVSATPFITSGIAQFLINGTSFFDLGPSSSAAGTYGPYTASTVIDSASFGGTIHTIALRLGFTGSGGNDQYAFTMNHTLEPITGVDAPATLALFGMGLVGLGWYRRRTVR